LANLIELTATATIPTPTEGRRVETLAKTDAFELKRLSLAKGCMIAEHTAPGPITVQCLVGRVNFLVEDEPHDLGAGRLLHLEPRVRHALKAEEDSVVLVTKMAPR
jgi:quercetin dioxygenase-like cupin family protein